MAMGKQVLRTLEVGRQRLTDGLLDHARACKANQRARLGDMEITQACKTRTHAAHGWVRHNDDEWQASVAHDQPGDRGARHLHQADRALLHARAT